jgi:hypothetical protein
LHSNSLRVIMLDGSADFASSMLTSVASATPVPPSCRIKPEKQITLHPH